MSHAEIALTVAERVVEDIAPTELVVFDVFRKRFLSSPDQFPEPSLEQMSAQVGFDLGQAATFLTPWIILVAREVLPLARETILEVIKLRLQKKLPLQRDEVSNASLTQLENSMLKLLKQRGFKSRELRKITRATIQVVLFDKQVAPQVQRLISQ